MPRMSKGHWVSMIASAGLAAAIALPAVAQQQSQQPPMPKPQQKQVDVDVTDKEVRQFASVYMDSRQVRQKYAGQFQNAEKPQDKQKVQQQMRNEMRKTIEDSPLSIKRYQKIARATAQDKQLRQRILKQVKQIQQAE